MIGAVQVYLVFPVSTAYLVLTDLKVLEDIPEETAVMELTDFLVSLVHQDMLVCLVHLAPLAQRGTEENLLSVIPA